MAELSEKELLMLDILVYVDFSKDVEGEDFTVGELVDYYINCSDEDLAKLHYCGDFGMDGVEPVELFRQVLLEMDADKGLQDLVITNVATDAVNGIDAACFVDPVTNEATVAFQGTDDSYRGWFDDIDGAGLNLSTPMQDASLKFIESLPYDGITVTGHSKGGNEAAYVTIESDKVDRCVSYDGQGFSEKYINQNSVQIAASKDKITTIAAHNDFISILLFPVSGQTAYVQNDGFGIEGHYATNLLFDNDFDEAGNFEPDTYCEQDDCMKALDKVTDQLVKAMLPDTEEYVTDALGALVSRYLGKNYFSESELEASNLTIKISLDRLKEEPNKIVYTLAVMYPYLVMDAYSIAFYLANKQMEMELGAIIKAKEFMEATIDAAKTYLQELQEKIISAYESIRDQAIELAVIYAEQVRKMIQTMKDTAALLALATIEMVKELAKTISDAVIDIEQLLVDTVVNALDDLGQCIQNLYDSVCKFINEQCNYGYQYALANSYICMDTGSLRSYAQRLESVNNRLGSVDERLDSLYGKVNLLDLWSLLNSDLMIHRSEIVRESAAYLYSTADEFDQIESTVVSQLG